MIVTMNDPASILNWWKVFPERHDAFLEFKIKSSPQFASAIREAQRRIAASSELSALQVASVRACRCSEAIAMPESASLSAYELRRGEPA